MEINPEDIKKISILLIRQIENLTIFGRWLPISKATRYSEMSKNTLMECINNGDIKASKKRGKWVVDRKSIDEYYEADIEAALFNDIAKRVEL
jgi:Helix-turn-helix domain